MQITKVLNFLFSDAKIKLDSLSSDQRKIITINGWIKDELIRIVEMKNATLNKNLITKHIGSGGYLSLSLFSFFLFFPLFQAFHPRHPRGTVFHGSVSFRVLHRHCSLLSLSSSSWRGFNVEARHVRCVTFLSAVSSLVVTPLTFDAIFLKRSSPNVAIATRR